MSSAVKLSEKIINEAKITSRAMRRSLAGQIEHWARIGKVAEDNPELSYDFLKDIFIAMEEVEAGLITPYSPKI